MKARFISILCLVLVLLSTAGLAQTSLRYTEVYEYEGNLLINLVIKNEYETCMGDTTAFVAIPEIGYARRLAVDHVRYEDTSNQFLMVELPEDIQKGEYLLYISVYNQYGEVMTSLNYFNVGI